IVALGIANVGNDNSGRADAGTGNWRPAAMSAGPLETVAIAADPDELIELAQNSKAESKPGTKPACPSARVWDLKARSANIQKIELSLTDPAEVSFQDNPLLEALNYLEDVHHIEIKIDDQALTDEGINRDTPVTLQMSGISLQSTLNLILEPLGLEYVI